jgi:hypothetical protein
MVRTWRQTEKLSGSGLIGGFGTNSPSQGALDLLTSRTLMQHRPVDEADSISRLRAAPVTPSGRRSMSGCAIAPPAASPIDVTSSTPFGNDPVAKCVHASSRSMRHRRP